MGSWADKRAQTMAKSDKQIRANGACVTSEPGSRRTQSHRMSRGETRTSAKVAKNAARPQEHTSGSNRVLARAPPWVGGNVLGLGRGVNRALTTGSSRKEVKRASRRQGVERTLCRKPVFWFFFCVLLLEANHNDERSYTRLL
jgi:hypothetical protein